MKIGICIDEDAHFNAARIDDRKGTLKVLEAIWDGQYYEEKVAEMEVENDPLSMDDDTWERFLQEFVQRGTFEICEID